MRKEIQIVLEYRNFATLGGFWRGTGRLDGGGGSLRRGE
jgi:hypothetical protein